MAPPPTSGSNDASTSAAFSAFYLQRATAELAGDLDQLRTAPDFLAAGDSDTNGGGGASSSSTKSAPPQHPTDNALQMLVGALRQGAGLFTPTEQARVIGAGSGPTVDDSGQSAHEPAA